MSESGTTERTRTTERVETQTVEDEEFYCPNCGQWFDEDEMVILGLGLTDSEDASITTPISQFGYETKDQLCEHCCKILFDYDGPTGFAEGISHEVDHWTWREMLAATVPLTISLVFFAVVTNWILRAATSIGTSLAGAGNPSLPEIPLFVVELFPIVVLLFILISISGSLCLRRI